MARRGFSNSLYVAELRYIQSIHETSELQNPDSAVREFLSLLQQLRCRWLTPKSIATLRADPFYYYLLARTKYYDGVFLEAIAENVGYIINIGCGTDTRSRRFATLLRQKGIAVLECDQPKAISIKQHMVKRLGTYDHISYASIDLNAKTWPVFEHWLVTHNARKALVLMEGVSPYIDAESFTRFLGLLGTTLPPASRVAYDFKIQGVADEFGLVGRIARPFRLRPTTDEISAFHKGLGFRLKHFEPSFELSTRLLARRKEPKPSLFGEDALVQLEVETGTNLGQANNPDLEGTGPAPLFDSLSMR